VIDGEAVVHEVVLRAPQEAVFAMFVDPTRLVRWIGITAELDPQPGGTFRFEIFPGEHCEGSYVEVVPPERVSMTWGWTTPSMRLPPGSSRVDVVLTEVDGGTHLRLEHHSLPDDLRPMHDDGWTTFLNRLAEELA
jgi:uncharacterized protein YndB with AHSA1/START domain